MTKRKITLREKTVEELKERGGQKRVDDAQRIIEEYLAEDTELMKKIILFFVKMPITTCQEMGVKLANEKKSKEDSQIFFDELMYQYKKVHPEFNYGGYYIPETDAEKQLFERLKKNAYAYDIIMEGLTKKKDCDENERKKILKYLNSGLNLLKKRGFMKIGIGFWVAECILEAAKATRKVFEEMIKEE